MREKKRRDRKIINSMLPEYGTIRNRWKERDKWESDRRRKRC